MEKVKLSLLTDFVVDGERKTPMNRVGVIMGKRELFIIFVFQNCVRPSSQRKNAPVSFL